MSTAFESAGTLPVLADAGHHDDHHSVSQSTVDSSGGGLLLNLSSSNVSQSTSGERDNTPPTSSDGLSSQDPGSQQSHHSPSDSTAVTSETLKLATAVPESRRHDEAMSPPRRRNSITGAAAGQKRTASGAVKSPTSTTSSGSVEHYSQDELQRASLDPSGAKIGELSSQLRARLSYALVKVQKGWQSHSLDEIESLASEQTSPISSTATLQGQSSLVTSPIDDHVGSIRNQSPSDALDRYRNGVSFTHPNASAAARSHTNGSAVHSPPPSSSQTRTYESFWRDHEGNSVSKLLGAQRIAVPPTSTYTSTSTSTSVNEQQQPPQQPAAGVGSLAPPVDIISRQHPRRSNAPAAPRISTMSGGTSGNRPPPFTTGLSNLSATSSSSFSTARRSLAAAAGPATPPLPSSQETKPRLLRTPSQKAAMEQDAVETLMFMSSPGHSQQSARARAHLPAFHAPAASLAAESAKLAAVTRPTGTLSSEVIDSGSLTRGQGRERSGGGGVGGGGQSFGQDDDIDIMLDAMSDDSSDEDDADLDLHGDNNERIDRERLRSTSATVGITPSATVA